MPEKISSLHDDCEMPFSEKASPEYDEEKGYPNRHKDIGERGERSMIQRIHQFGITGDDLKKFGIENLTDITEEHYSALVREAIERQYDTLFASVFAEWPDKAPEDQLATIKRVSGIYRNWGFNLLQQGSRVGKGPNLVIDLEGADVVRALSDIDELYDLGIRSVTVQYGNDNALATADGLTVFGRQGIAKMLDLGIILDLAHAYPKTRRDILDLASETRKGHLVAYTHGATSEDIARDFQFSAAAGKRGISEEEVSRIIGLGGIIGLGVSRPFFQNIGQIAERIDQICQMDKGPQSLGLGSDFGGVSPAWSIGINSSEDVAKIGDVLADKFGYPDSQIKNILRNNIHNWARKIFEK